jgi:hypothetical protein
MGLETTVANSPNRPFKLGEVIIGVHHDADCREVRKNTQERRNMHEDFSGLVPLAIPRAEPHLLSNVPRR